MCDEHLHHQVEVVFVAINDSAAPTIATISPEHCLEYNQECDGFTLLFLLIQSLQVIFHTINDPLHGFCLLYSGAVGQRQCAINVETAYFCQ